MNNPVNCSSLDSLKIGASPPSSTLRPLFIPVFEDERWLLWVLGEDWVSVGKVGAAVVKVVLEL